MRKTLSLTFVLSLIFCALSFQRFPVVNALEKNENTVVCEQVDTRLINAPTVVTELKNSSKVQEILESKQKPSNVIVNIDQNLNVIGESGDVISDFVSLHKSELGEKVLFVVRIESEESANAFIKMINETYYVLDIAVISSNSELVKKIKTTEGCSHIRGVIEYQNETDLYEIVKTTQESGAIVAVIPQNMATITNVRYIQARFKTVWVRVSNDSRINLHNCINSGAYGLITENYAKMYETLCSYKMGYTRTPFNVAHRGLPNEYNENSVSGLIGAIENGATHVELDGYLTKDKKIVLMHDKTLDRTTNGTGQVESKTLEEIRDSKLDLFGEEEIPSFDDIVNVLKQSDVVLIFEIKSSNKEIVTVLKNKIYEHQIQKQIVVISFNLPILAEMKRVLPEIPTANLNTASEKTFAEVLKWMGEYKTGIDTTVKNTSANFNRILCDHGIVGWYWTYNTFGEGTPNGFVGQTNNYASFASGEPMYAIALKEEYKTQKSVVVGDTLEVIFMTYDKKEKVLACRVVFCEEYKDRYEVICYNEMPNGLYSQILTVKKIKGGCASKLGSNLILSTFALLSLVTFVKKQKQNCR